MLIEIYIRVPYITERYHKTTIVGIRDMPEKYFLASARLRFYRIMIENSPKIILLILLADNANFPELAFNLLGNRIDFPHPTILLGLKPFVLVYKLMPKYIPCVVGRVEAIIRPARHLNSVDMLDDRVDLIILNVEYILVMHVHIVYKNEFNSLLFALISYGVIELAGYKASIRMLYKNDH
jgi:hypothetical protein